MALEVRNYDISDMETHPLSEAPSLDIPHIITDEFFTPKDGGKYMLFLAHVSRDYRPARGCPFCGSHDITLEGRTEPRLVHDVIRNNYRVDIVLLPPRMFCKGCKQRFVPEIKGISGNRQMTTRLEDFIREECLLQPFTVLSERTGFSLSTISAILDEEIEKYDDMRSLDPPAAPRVLGIDEKHLGNEMRGTLVDVESGYLLDILKDNKADTMKNAIMALDGWNTNIQVVTTDMNNSYINWLPGLLPSATIVIDKFHVIKDVEQAITTCRKALIDSRKRKIEQLSDPKEKSRQSAILRIVTRNGRLFHFSILRLMREKDLERLDKLATVIDEFPEFKMLYNLHYMIEYMYEQTTREDAENEWENWMTFLPPANQNDYTDWCNLYMFDEECFQAFRKFTRRGFLQFAPYILNYFNSSETRMTNATTEGLNSLIGDVNIEGKGYKFEHLRAKCLYAPLVHEKIRYGVNVSTIKKWKPNINKQQFIYSNSDVLYDKYISSTLESSKRYEFVSRKVSLSIPSIRFPGNNEWLHQSFSDRYLIEMENKKKEILIGMEHKDRLPPEPTQINLNMDRILEAFNL